MRNHETRELTYLCVVAAETAAILAILVIYLTWLTSPSGTLYTHCEQSTGTTVMTSTNGTITTCVIYPSTKTTTTLDR